MKAELRPAGSFIQNTPTTTVTSMGADRRHSVAAAPSRRAKTQITAARQVPAATHHDEATSPGDVGCHRRVQRPSSAWKSRNRRPRFTDNFDVFDDPIIDLDVDTLNLNDLVDANTSATKNDLSSEPNTSLDVGKPRTDLSQTPRAWQGITASATSSEHQPNSLSKPVDVAKSNCTLQATNTSSENWTSSEEATKRDSVELTPDFELSHIRAKVLENHRNGDIYDDRVPAARVSMSMVLPDLLVLISRLTAVKLATERQSSEISGSLIQIYCRSESQC